MANSVKLHRILTAPPEKVYRAFTDPDAVVKFYAPHGFTCKVHQMEPQVGGHIKMSFTNFTTKHSHSFGGKFIEMKPNESIKYAEKFDDPNLAGEMYTTITLHKVMCGTELIVVQEGIPAAIPTEMCYLGWQQTLSQLALLVEPDIKDGK